jgi:hypothetical protein
VVFDLLRLGRQQLQRPRTNCSVTVAGDLSVTANFTHTLMTLTVHKLGRGTVSSQPAGIMCGRQCRHAFVPVR